MIVEIGVVAREIIELIDKSKRSLTISEVLILINRPIDIVYMALGWLIREHFVGVFHAGDENFLFVVNRDIPSCKDSRIASEHLN